jgi:hypothetical protein
VVAESSGPEHRLRDFPCANSHGRQVLMRRSASGRAASASQPRPWAPEGPRATGPEIVVHIFGWMVVFPGGVDRLRSWTRTQIRLVGRRARGPDIPTAWRRWWQLWTSWPPRCWTGWPRPPWPRSSWSCSGCWTASTASAGGGWRPSTPAGPPGPTT